jgi:hypothetical protein
VVFTLVAAPFLVPVVADIAGGGWAAALNASYLAAAVLVPVSLVLSSAAGAYFATLWTIAYRRFGQEGELPEPPPLAA